MYLTLLRHLSTLIDTFAKMFTTDINSKILSNAMCC